MYPAVHGACAPKAFNILPTNVFVPGDQGQAPQHLEPPSMTSIAGNAGHHGRTAVERLFARAARNGPT